MLVHICCSVDSHFFISRLKELYPDKKIVGFFYNPNIHPKGEYDLRLLDAIMSCKKLNVPILVGEYEPERWLEYMDGFELEEEKGERCSRCFDMRLFKSAEVIDSDFRAILWKESTIKEDEIDIFLEDRLFTTTLLASPMKKQSSLFELGAMVGEKFGAEFVKVDFRSGGGVQKQSIMSYEENLYRQNYCGCMFALNRQRERQGKVAFELFSPINQSEILPGSIEFRTKMFETRDELERGGERYIIIKESINGYRLLSGNVYKIDSECQNGENRVIYKATESYIFKNSKSKKKVKITNIEWIKIEKNLPIVERCLKIEVGVSSRDDSIFLRLDSLNHILKNLGGRYYYKSIHELQKNPPAIEGIIRIILAGEDSISPIVVIKDMVSEIMGISG